MEKKYSFQVPIKIIKITEISKGGKKKKEKKKIETQILSCVLLNCVSNDPRKGLDPGPVHRSFTDHNHHSLSVAFLPCPK